MIHLSNAVLVALLLVNLLGLALVFRPAASSWLFCRTASPVAFVSLCFFLEHFVGLGRLGWVYPLTTALSLLLIVFNRAYLRSRWRTECVFFMAFLYALAWRYWIPDIYASSEKITDLTFVANYLPGGKLPPVDRWLPPLPFSMYYAMQHYAAALMGRIFDLSPGTAYNLGFCTIVALAITAAAGVGMLFLRRRWPTIVLTTAFVLGGPGTALVMHSINPSPPFYASVRFIGSCFTQEFATLPFGKWLITASGVSDKTPDLPIELFSYLGGLGDYHPPLSGYLLLLLALLAIAHIESGLAMGPACFLLGATVPLTIACNTWDLPLQAALAAGYLAIRAWMKKPLAWRQVIAGLIFALFLIQPFLAQFAAGSHAQIGIRLVPAALRTPPLLWLLTFYPVLIILALHVFLGERTRLSLGLCLFWIAWLAFSEFVYMDDLYDEKNERFNTCLKWWPWIYSGILLSTGVFNLGARSRLCRWGTIAVMLSICLFARDLGIHFGGASKSSFGQLDGAAWIRRNPSEGALLDVLRHEPQSIVLERIPENAYNSQPALTIFAGQTAFLGWPDHENTWRGDRADVDARSSEVEQFFNGEMADSAQWLEVNHIRYILWLRDDNKLAENSFEKINTALKGRFFWRPFHAEGEPRVGMWSRIAQ